MHPEYAYTSSTVHRTGSTTCPPSAPSLPQDVALHALGVVPHLHAHIPGGSWSAAAPRMWTLMLSEVPHLHAHIPGGSWSAAAPRYGS
eukprot:1147886-Pelagomonas_calceolata.AAC.6